MSSSFMLMRLTHENLCFALVQRCMFDMSMPHSETFIKCMARVMTYENIIICLLHFVFELIIKIYFETQLSHVRW